MDKNRHDILIVNSSDADNTALIRVLSPGYNVYSEGNLQNAVTAAVKNLPDIIIFDNAMSDPNSNSVISALKNSKNNIETPVIAIIRIYNGNLDENKIYALGADDYLFEPFSPAAIKFRVLNQIKLLDQRLKMTGAIVTEEALKKAFQESEKALDIMKSILNNTDAIVYVSDIETCEILFANDALKRQFGIKDDITGMLCCDVFEAGPDGGCDWCPRDILDKAPDNAVVWENKNSKTKRYYQNTNRYIDWTGGKKAHLHFSVDLTDIKEIQHNLERNQRMLYAINNAATLWLNTDIENFENYLLHSMKIIAEAVKVDRMYIWKNYIKDGELYCKKLYDLSEVSGPANPTLFPEGMPYKNNITRWEKELSEGRCINNIVREMPQEEQKIFTDVVSMLIEPVVIKGQFWGFVGFDDCKEERIFTKGEESILRSGSMMIANAFSRNEMIMELRDTAQILSRRETIMDTLNKASVILVSRSEKTFAETMTVGIRPIADTIGLDRISIWRNLENEDGLHASQIYRWDREKGGTTKKEKELEAVSYNRFAPHLIEHFSDGKSINSPVKLLPESDLLLSFGAVSVFIMPVFIGNKLWGFVLFEDCCNNRYFENDYTDMMRYASFLIASAVIRDETEREVLEAEERIKLMLDSTPLCCQLWDRNINIIDCNEAVIRLFGFRSKKEYISRYFELFPIYQPDGRRSYETIMEMMDKAFEDGYCAFEWMHRTPDGIQIPTEVILVRVKYGEDFIVAGYTRDLREQKKMLAEIEHRDNLLKKVNQTAIILLNSDIDSFERDVHQSMKMIGEALDVDCVYIWKNHIVDNQLCCYKLYDWATDQSKISKTTSFCYSQLVPGWEKLLSQGDCINNLVRELSPKIKEFLSETGVLSIFVVPVFVEEQFWGFVGMDDCRCERVYSEEEVSILRSCSLLFVNSLLRNEMLINNRQASVQLEEALINANEANRAKSAFLANMSHEIRTPMNSIIGFAELSIVDDIPAKTKEYLELILENSELLLHIINDILDLSKIESGKIVLAKAPFNMADVFSSCMSAVIQKAKEKEIVLDCHTGSVSDMVVIGDSFKLSQVLINLLSNAVKFTSTGTVKLIANEVKSDSSSVTIRFEVKDSGIGMTPEQVSKIFEPFMQADDSIERKYGGTGLGLSIAKNLLELMGSSLEVESTLDVGSTFSFEITFDFVDDIDYSLISKTNYKSHEKPTFEGEVLICEDSLMNQHVVCEHLARVGITTVVAHNGQEAVDIVSERIKNGKKAFDLIFMDIHMPVMNGLEAASKITEMGVKTPMVALTANIMHNDLEVYKSNGMTGYLGKPFKTKDLWQCLAKYLTPLGVSVTNTDIEAAEKEKLLQILRLNFVKSNQTTYEDIQQAISKGDIELAERIAHTLKSNAGQIGEYKLQRSATTIESMLNDISFNEGSFLSGEQMSILKTSLNSVLKKLAPLLEEANMQKQNAIVDKKAISDLYDKLEPMLLNHNPECMNLVDEIRLIPGAEELANQIEDFEFRDAYRCLQEIRAH